MENASLERTLGSLAGAPDECFVLDLEGRVVAANDAALRALGITLDELRGQPAWELFSCLTRTGFERLLAASRWEGPQSLLGHLRCRDGTLLATDTRFWLDERAGEPRLMALAREMRGCQGVVEERDQLVHLVEASDEVVLLFDAEHRVTFANAAALSTLGFARHEDVAGLALHELVVLDQRRLVEELIVPRLFHGGWDGELELRSWRNPSTRTPCWAHVFPVLHSRSRKRVGFALMAHDVSSRRAAEQRRTRLLRLAELSRRVALQLLSAEDLNEAVFLTLEGVAGILGVAQAYLHRFREDGRWVLRTHEWSPTLGRRHESGGPTSVGAGHRWALDVLSRGDPLRVEETASLQEATGAQEPSGSDERSLLLLPVLVHGRLESAFGFVHERGRPWEDDEVAAVQLIVDSFARGVERRIAERERDRAQRELEAAVEREKVASRYKSEFLASMSHELRTPMNAIRGYAELLARPNPERALQEQWIQNLLRSTEYLLGLIHDVLDLSKIEAGHMHLEPEPVALAEVLASVMDLLGATAREKCLEFSIEFENECPESFETDPVRLKQILVNLTGNAIKFTSQGSVGLRVRQHSVPGRGPTLEVAVHDTGIGIPKEAMDRLFRAFSQVNQRSGGTGLGLQISRSLARLLGGEITVESEVGRGSVFRLEVPLRGARGSLRALPRRSAGPQRLERTVPAALANKRILVVDDSFENREVLRFLLTEAGASCESAMNGAAGVERALAAERSHRPFDAILMDMNMPVMDGFEATSALKAAGLRSPVVALTAMALAGDEERCRAAGCVDYVAKPIVPSVFFETLARHLGTAQGESAQAPSRGSEAPEAALLSMAQHPRFRGLVQRYMASFPELVERLRTLEQEGRLEEVRTLVHRLRGTAASYGFPAISQAAGRCEDAIRGGVGRVEIARLLDDLLGRLTLAAAG